ncbi:MAG: hypothetical protein HY710_12895 [Candidatus Latescibacteria bacterium]|nr:hypothetical protein [Candidatus Latescibacterota bacterium]
MPQLQVEVPEPIAEQLRQRAAARCAMGQLPSSRSSWLTRPLPQSASVLLCKQNSSMVPGIASG